MNSMTNHNNIQEKTKKSTRKAEFFADVLLNCKKTPAAHDMSTGGFISFSYFFRD